jgi:hypothetical protein
MSTAVDSTGGQALSEPEDAAKETLSRMRSLVVSGFTPIITVIRFQARGRAAAKRWLKSLKF